MGALALGVGLAASVKIGVDELLEAERVNSQTAAAIASTGGAANTTAKQIQGLASRLSVMSGVDDELIQSGSNLLLTFTQIRNAAGKGNDVFDQATKATLDLSVAMGKDMRSSSILVGKALNDPIKGATALSRAGVQLTQQQKDQIKAFVESGQTMKAQKIILRELETQFGGSAKALGETGTGAVNRLKVSFAELSAEIVGALAPNLANLAASMLKAVESARAWAKTKDGKKVLNDLSTAIKKMGAIVVVAAKGIAAIIKMMYQWRSVLVPVIAGATAIAASMRIASIATAAWTVATTALNVAMYLNPVGLVVLAVIGLTAALIVAYKRSEKFRAIVSKTWSMLKSFSKVLLDNKGKVVMLLGPLGLLINAGIRIYKHWGTIKQAFNAVKSAITSMSSAIMGVLATSLKWLRQQGAAVVAPIKSAFQAVRDVVADIIAKVDSLISKLKKAGEKAASVGNSIKGAVTFDVPFVGKSGKSASLKPMDLSPAVGAVSGRSASGGMSINVYPQSQDVEAIARRVAYLISSGQVNMASGVV
jgi:hypothetical protein